MIEVIGMNTYYETSHILFDVTFDVHRGEVVCLLGRNGAGKTTVIHSIMGLIQPRSGSIKFEGNELIKTTSYYRAQRGMGFVPDARRIFPTLTVRENLEIAEKKASHDDQQPWTVDRIYELFPVLQDLESRKGAHLSGGEQQMLAIARALMGNPILILMDEPAEGLSPLIVRTLKEQVLKLKKQGQTILLSEQNLPFALAVSDRGYVIEKGVIRYQGSISELEANEEVKRSYLMV
jgi:branched-chain amino acid transport system ATP-binding protein